MTTGRHARGPSVRARPVPSMPLQLSLSLTRRTLTLPLPAFLGPFLAPQWTLCEVFMFFSATSPETTFGQSSQSLPGPSQRPALAWHMGQANWGGKGTRMGRRCMEGRWERRRVGKAGEGRLANR